MSSDKKSDDFVVRIPDRNDSFQEEKDPFLARTPSHRVSPPALQDKFAKFQNNPPVSILCYCLSSISMTVVNKYCVSGKNWNLNLFYLAVQVSTSPTGRACDECAALLGPIADTSGLNSPSSVSQLSSYANKVASSRLSLPSTRRRPRSVRCPGESRKTAERAESDLVLTLNRVSDFRPSRRHDLHEHQVPPVSLRSRLHDLQELDHYCHRIRRGPLVRWRGYTYCPSVLWLDGPQLRYCRLG